MTQCNSVNIKLLNLQFDKLKLSIKIQQKGLKDYH